MKKWILLPALALSVATVVGCTHGATQDAAAVQLGALPYASADNVQYVTAERTPAQAQVEPKITWTAKTLAWNVSAKGGQLQPQIAKIEQVMEWQSTEEYYEEDDVLVWEGYVKSTCSDYDCGTAEANGDSERWNKFYRVPKAEKPKALVEAIKGLDLKSARGLVDGNYFHKKPRSWPAFKAEMERAEGAKVVSTRDFNEIVYEFRADNIVALGYTSSGQQCRPVDVPCRRWEQKWARQPVKKTRPVTSRKILNSIDREVYVNVVNPQLQSWEVDKLYIKIGNEPQDVAVSSEGPTVYRSQMSVQGAKTLVQVDGVERKRLALPADVYRRNGEQFVQQGNQAVFTLFVDPKYVPTAGGDDRLELEYKVQWCKPNWTGVCFGKWQETPVKRGPIQGSGQAVMRATPPAGVKTRVVYSVVRVGSKWYNDKPTAQRETDTIRMR